MTGSVAAYAPGTNGKRDNFLGYITVSGTINAEYSWYNQWWYEVPSDLAQLVNIKAKVRLFVRLVVFRWSDVGGGAAVSAE